MYSKLPGTGSTDTYTCKEPDAAQTDPRELLPQHLTHPPFNTLNFHRATAGDWAQLGVTEMSKVFSSLAGCPSDEDMTPSTKAIGTGARFRHSLDRRAMEEARKLAACLVESQLLHCDPPVVESMPITLNLPSSMTPEGDYGPEKPYQPVHYSVYLRFDNLGESDKLHRRSGPPHHSPTSHPST